MTAAVVALVSVTGTEPGWCVGRDLEGSISQKMTELRTVTINWGKTRKTLCIPKITIFMSFISVDPFIRGQGPVMG